MIAPTAWLKTSIKSSGNGGRKIVAQVKREQVDTRGTETLGPGDNLASVGRLEGGRVVVCSTYVRRLSPGHNYFIGSEGCASLSPLVKLP